MANTARDGNYTSKLNQIGSESPSGILEFLTALNIFLSITASLGNALIIIALHKVSSIQPPTTLFFRCLAVNDLCVGLIVQPLFATYITSRITEMNVTDEYYVHEVCGALSMILCGVSALTSTAISVDRLLALSLGLRYRHVVTLRRVCAVIICFWFISISVGFIRMLRKDIAFQEGSVFMTLSLVTSIFCYTRIHLKLRHQQAQVQNHVYQGQPNGEETPLNIARYKKTVSSILWVQLALVACYVPFVTVIGLNVTEKDNQLAWRATASLVYLNASLNPILYCWKIREVRQEVKDTIRQLNCF